MELSFMQIASILVLGVGAQWLSWRLKIPSILILLLTGIVAGPLTGFLKPDEVFGDLLMPFVSLSVAIILFEGGLSLKITQLKKIGSVVVNLVSIGVLISWLLTALLAWWFLRLELSLAVLLGAILVVTGPTVIIPLLRQLRPTNKIASILRWEAMVNDPIGVILAVIVFESIMVGGFQEATAQALVGLFKTLVLGGILGTASSLVMTKLLQRHWIPDYLQSPVTLMLLTFAYTVSNMLQADSGLVTVTVMGVVLANQKKITVRHIIEFKENLRILLISSLFIVLAARLELSYIVHIGWGGVAFFFALVLVVRPLAVFFSTLKSDLNWREKLFLCWMAPRGIVAAAVASIFALELGAEGVFQAERLVSITFFVIIGTVFLYGVTGPWVAYLLKIAQPNPQGCLILGAHEWARKIAGVIKAHGFRVLLVDTNWINVGKARAEGLEAVSANIFRQVGTDEIELDGIGNFLALTPNDEVNTLAAVHLSEIFGRSQVFQLPVVPVEASAEKGKAFHNLHGRFLFDEKGTFYKLNQFFSSGAHIAKVQLTKDFGWNEFKERYHQQYMILFVLSESGTLRISPADHPETPKTNETIFALVWDLPQTSK